MKKHNLKVGDKVKIRSNLEERDHYHSKGIIAICKSMLEYRGKEATVTKYYDNNDIWTPAYYLDIDNGAWVWQENMFEPIKEENEI